MLTFCWDHTEKHILLIRLEQGWGKAQALQAQCIYEKLCGAAI